MIAAYSVAAEAAGVGRCSCKRVFAPGLPELFEFLGVVRATAHSINVLRNERMVVTRQSDPIDVYCAFVTGVSSQSEANETVDRTVFVLNEIKQLSDDNIRARNAPDCWHHTRLRFAVNNVVDLDGLHRCPD